MSTKNMKQLHIIIIFLSLQVSPIVSQETSSKGLQEYRLPLTEKLIRGLDRLTKDSGSIVATFQSLGIAFPEGSSAAIDRESGILTIVNTPQSALTTLGQIWRFSHEEADALVAFVELTSVSQSLLPFTVPKHFLHESEGVGSEGGYLGIFRIDGRPYLFRYDTGSIFSTTEKLTLEGKENLVYYEETAIRGAAVQFIGYGVNDGEKKVSLHLWIPEITTRFIVYLENRELIAMAIKDLREISIK